MCSRQSLRLDVCVFDNGPSLSLKLRVYRKFKDSLNFGGFVGFQEGFS